MDASWSISMKRWNGNSDPLTVSKPNRLPKDRQPVVIALTLPDSLTAVTDRQMFMIRFDVLSVTACYRLDQGSALLKHEFRG